GGGAGPGASGAAAAAGELPGRRRLRAQSGVRDPGDEPDRAGAARAVRDDEHAADDVRASAGPGDLRRLGGRGGPRGARRAAERRDLSRRPRDQGSGGGPAAAVARVPRALGRADGARAEPGVQDLPSPGGWQGRADLPDLRRAGGARSAVARRYGGTRQPERRRAGQAGGALNFL